jgi:hypothetical protein
MAVETRPSHTPGTDMNRTPVSSSNLKSVGYDPYSQTLEIEFHNGGIYQYSQVPQSVYSGLMGASSRGEYFESHIKTGGYPFQKFR